MKRTNEPPEGSGTTAPVTAPAEELFDRSAARYEESVDRSISFTGRSASFFAERKVDLLDGLLRARGQALSGSVVLDVGCGTGTTDQHLVRRVKELSGADVSDEMLALARQSVPGAEFRAYDGNSLPFPAGTFDLVLAICVLHHVPPPERGEFVRELARVTRLGGHVAIFEHNPRNPLTRRAVRGCELDAGVTLAGARDVRRLFSDARTEVVCSDYFLFTPFAGRIGHSIDRWFRRLPLGGQYVVMAEAS